MTCIVELITEFVILFLSWSALYFITETDEVSLLYLNEVCCASCAVHNKEVHASIISSQTTSRFQSPIRKYSGNLVRHCATCASTIVHNTFNDSRYFYMQNAIYNYTCMNILSLQRVEKGSV